MVESEATRVLQQIDSNMAESIDLLEDFVKIPSRRQNPEGMLDAAEFVASRAGKLGADVEVIPWESSYPYVLAQFEGDDDRRVMMFNHYDVEVEPVPADMTWTVGGPFDPVHTSELIYGRGVADDKGSLIARLACVQAFRDAGVRLPIGVSMLFEGKRELTSPGLGSFYDAHRDRLYGDGAIWENSFISDAGRPVLRLGEKGLLYARIDVTALSAPASSQFTAVLPSAAWRLVWALSSLQDRDGQGLITSLPLKGDYRDSEQLPRFEHIDPPAAHEARRISPAPPRDPNIDAAAAIRVLPTINIVSIAAGEESEDVQLRLVTRASATVEVRLLPGVSSAAAEAALREHLGQLGFDDLTVSVLARSEPCRTRAAHPFVRRMAEAAGRAFGTEPIAEEASMAIGNQGVCGEMPIVGVGVFRSDASKDGADESIRVEDFRNGIRTIALLLLSYQRASN